MKNMRFTSHDEYCSGNNVKSVILNDGTEVPIADVTRDHFGYIQKLQWKLKRPRKPLCMSAKEKAAWLANPPKPGPGGWCHTCVSAGAKTYRLHAGANRMAAIIVTWDKEESDL